MEFEYKKIEEVLKRIFSIEDIKDKIFVSGGIVPWIISATDSKRKHGDIDFICRQKDMQLIREKLVEYGIYDKNLDSLSYPQKGEVKDYGVDTYIAGVPIGFYPYEIQNGKLIQRSFSQELVNGKPDLKVKIIDGLDEKDYLTTTVLEDGTVIGHSTLEMVRATKLKAGRQKDYYDILQIDSIGTNPERQARVDAAVGNMISTLDERKMYNTKNKLKNTSKDFDER